MEEPLGLSLATHRGCAVRGLLAPQSPIRSVCRFCGVEDGGHPSRGLPWAKEETVSMWSIRFALLAVRSRHHENVVRASR